MGALQARPLSSIAGVEVSGVDFTRPLDDEQAAELKDLFQRHRLVLFRGHELSDEDHLRLCNYLLPAHPQVGYMSNTPEIKGFHPDFNLLFHSDFAFTAYPLLGISLYAVELDPDAAPTRFINTEVAYREMPADMKKRFEALDVVMLANTVDGREDRPARTVRIGDDAPTDRYIRSVRPTISEHRVTGTPFVLASEQQASHFDGVSMDDSDGLLAELFGHMYSERFMYEHDWQLHDLVIWDNLTLQHGRRDNPDEVRRCLRRVTMNEISMAELLEGTIYSRATSTG